VAVVLSKRRQAKRGSSTKGDNKGRPAKLVTYCPECPTKPADPELSERVMVQVFTKKASCTKGHTWPVGSEARSAA
jgi:hypothetical protein